MSNHTTESSDRAARLHALYRWSVATALIRAIDLERTLARAGRLLGTVDNRDLATVSRVDFARQWDRSCRG